MFTKFDLELAFNAGRRFEGGEPKLDDSEEIFEEWFEAD